MKAHNTIMQSGADKVVKLFSQYTLTTSLNYFCCLTNEVNYNNIIVFMDKTRIVVIGKEDYSRITPNSSWSDTPEFDLSRSRVHGE